jgi:hypothetical protein
MNKSSEKNKKGNFLEQGSKESIAAQHKKYLGTAVPEGYFTRSKSSILDKIKEEPLLEQQPKKQLIFWMKPQIKYAVAASLVFILGITIWMQNLNTSKTVNKINFDEVAFSHDVLLESLLVEESEMEAFTNATLFQEVVVKAELSEQKLDNLILNSLIVEDSLLDNYIDTKFVETIIL